MTDDELVRGDLCASNQYGAATLDGVLRRLSRRAMLDGEWRMAREFRRYWCNCTVVSVVSTYLHRLYQVCVCDDLVTIYRPQQVIYRFVD